MANPDKEMLGTPKADGTESVRYMKELSNGRIVIVESPASPISSPCSPTTDKRLRLSFPPVFFLRSKNGQKVERSGTPLKSEIGKGKVYAQGGSLGSNEFAVGTRKRRGGRCALSVLFAWGVK